MHPKHTTEPLTRADAFDIARRCRQEFWEMQGLAVVNHTIPDYHTALLRQPSQSTSSLHVQIGKLVPVCRNENHV